MKYAMKLVLALIFVLIPLSSSRAAIWYVAASGNDASAGTNWITAKQTIQAAVDASTSNDTVLVSNGVYAAGGSLAPGQTLTSRVVIAKAIIVASVNGPEVTTIKGGGTVDVTAVRCVYLTNGASLVGFTLTNGFTRAETSVNGCGGGVFMDRGGTVSNCTIVGNTANYSGGGVYNSAVGRVLNCRVTRNTGSEGGGIFLGGGGSVIDCSIMLNLGQNAGGGVYCASGGTLTRCLIATNRAHGIGATVFGGGGVWISFGSINSCEIRSNVASNWGGGVFIYRVGFISDCTISVNSAGVGGGATFYSNSSSYDGGQAFRSIISSNTSSAGGGILCYQGGIVSNCTLIANSAGIGGGISLQYSGGKVANCLISRNVSTNGAGGGVHCFNFVGGQIISSEISRNTASDLGGGAYFSSGGSLYNCTIAGNSAATRGGGIMGNPGGYAYNSIVISNTAPTDANFGHTGAYTGEFYNSCSLPLHGGTNNIASSPLFVDAANFNYRLQPGSPCLDKGSNAYAVGATDLDGRPRIMNTNVDMGAFEYVPGGGTYLVTTPAIDNITVPVGQSVTGRTITVQNGGYGSMSYTLVTNATWLSLSTSAGASTGEVDVISVNLASQTLGVGIYTGIVTVTGTGAPNSPKTIPFVLTIVSTNITPGLDATNLSWSIGGNQPWFYESTVTHDGVDAAQSGDINDSQQSYIETSITGPGTLDFWWSVSSEGSFDILRFYVDGVQKGAISGASAWLRVTTNLAAGAHTLRWSYAKDSSVSVGADAGWLDEVSFVPAAASGYDLYVQQITNGMTNYYDSATGDGYANLLKYATGSSPTNADNLARMSALDITNGVFVMTFNRNTNALDVTLIVEGGADLPSGGGWNGLATNKNGIWSGAATVVESGAGNPRSVSATDNSPPVSNRFMRIRVTRP